MAYYYVIIKVESDSVRALLFSVLKAIGKKIKVYVTRALPANAVQAMHQTQLIAVKIGKDKTLIHASQLISVKGDGDTSHLRFTGNRKGIASHGIGFYDEFLALHGKTRVHNQYIVDMKYCSRIAHESGYRIFLKDPEGTEEEVPVSDKYKTLIIGMVVK